MLATVAEDSQTLQHREAFQQPSPLNKLLLFCQLSRFP